MYSVGTLLGQSPKLEYLLRSSGRLSRAGYVGKLSPNLQYLGTQLLGQVMGFSAAGSKTTSCLSLEGTSYVSPVDMQKEKIR